MRGVLLRDDEAELREAFSRYPEHEAADWATQTLAVVIKRAGDSGWANRSPADFRRRAIVLLAIRVLRAARAGMAVHAAGWEVEGRALDRLLIENRARLIQVAEDDSDETGRLWLERRLHEKRSITSALKASAPEIDPSLMGDLYHRLSQDAHADVGGILGSLLAAGDDSGAAEVTWGPRHTIAARQSLVLFASLAAETATFLAIEADVEHPDRDALARRIGEAQRTLDEAGRDE